MSDGPFFLVYSKFLDAYLATDDDGEYVVVKNREKAGRFKAVPVPAPGFGVQWGLVKP